MNREIIYVLTHVFESDTKQAHEPWPLEEMPTAIMPSHPMGHTLRVCRYIYIPIIFMSVSSELWIHELNEFVVRKRKITTIMLVP